VSFFWKSPGFCAVIMLLCSHQALMHSLCLLGGHHTAAQGKVSQLFLQAVATRESWEVAGSRGSLLEVRK